MPAMRIRVVAGKCEGHNRCHALAPELFEVDELGLATARSAGIVPPGLEVKAELAIANCPEFAIEETTE